MTIYDNPSSVQVELGCDCCEVNGELVPDKHIWIVGGITYGKKHIKMYQNYLSQFFCQSAVEGILF